MKSIELIGAEVSKTIKDMLKAKFPKTKFSVRYDSFAGGDSVNVTYIYGPSYDQVNELVKPYQQGTFNSMTDSYENHGKRIVETKEGEAELKGGAKYISVTKDLPFEKYEDFSNQFKSLFEFITDKEDIRKTIRATYMRTDFGSSNPENVRITKKLTDQSGWENLIQFEFDAPAEMPKEPGKIELLPYSEFSFAVFGKILQESKQLKEIGRFNRYLTHPNTGMKTPGWIFQNRKINEVKMILQLP